MGGHVEVVREGQVGWLQVSHLERRNALTPPMITALIEAVEALESDRSIRCLVLTGAGHQAFSAGFDITYLDSPDSPQPGVERDMVEALAERIANAAKPTIAMINGDAVGAGCDLALSCDIRIAAETARFGMPPVRLGILYDWRGIARLFETGGLAAAQELLLTGHLITASRALQLGLVQEIVEAAHLRSRVTAVAEEVAAGAPLAVAGAKAILRQLTAARMSLPEHALEAIRRIQAQVWASADAREGAAAFRERRRPRFTGQ